MIMTMYIRPDQLKKLKLSGKGYASTFRDSDSCFVIQVDIKQIDLETHEYGMPCDNYYISLI